MLQYIARKLEIETRYRCGRKGGLNMIWWLWIGFSHRTVGIGSTSESEWIVWSSFFHFGRFSPWFWAKRPYDCESFSILTSKRSVWSNQFLISWSARMGAAIVHRPIGRWSFSAVCALASLRPGSVRLSAGRENCGNQGLVVKKRNCHFSVCILSV